MVENLAKDLQAEFPDISGFSATNLWYMSQFYMEYQGNKILQPLVGEISWTKHILIMSKCKDIRERQFYIIATKPSTNLYFPMTPFFTQFMCTYWPDHGVFGLLFRMIFCLPDHG